MPELTQTFRGRVGYRIQYPARYQNYKISQGWIYGIRPCTKDGYAPLLSSCYSQNRNWSRLISSEWPDIKFSIRPDIKTTGNRTSCYSRLIKTLPGGEYVVHPAGGAFNRIYRGTSPATATVDATGIYGWTGYSVCRMSGKNKISSFKTFKVWLKRNRYE